MELKKIAVLSDGFPFVIWKIHVSLIMVVTDALKTYVKTYNNAVYESWDQEVVVFSSRMLWKLL